MLDESYGTKTVPKEEFSIYPLTVVEGFKPVPMLLEEEIRIEPFLVAHVCSSILLTKERDVGLQQLSLCSGSIGRSSAWLWGFPNG
jgi:hypothetical protein